MLLYPDRGSCTLPDLLTGSDIGDAYPSCNCVVADFIPTARCLCDPKCFGIGCKMSGELYLTASAVSGSGRGGGFLNARVLKHKTRIHA